jgi:hypothetical protein
MSVSKQLGYIRTLERVRARAGKVRAIYAWRVRTLLLRNRQLVEQSKLQEYACDEHWCARV